MKIHNLFAKLSLFAALTALPSSVSASPITQTTYTFSGACIDCAGTATAILVLQNYTPGTALSNANFVSFHYNGTNLLAPFDVLPANLEFLQGIIPSSLPSTARVFVFGVPTLFQTFTNGNWEVGSSILDDFGNGGVWAAGVPEPSTVLLLGSGLALFGLRRWRARA